MPINSSSSRSVNIFLPARGCRAGYPVLHPLPRLNYLAMIRLSGVTRGVRGVRGVRTAPGDTITRGDTKMQNITVYDSMSLYEIILMHCFSPATEMYY